ncbi:MAG: cytidine deaminase [Clostridiales bacterium]|nr:cytidine deaminase [Clostridiales bacterium]
MSDEVLFSKAEKAREASYCPYSGYAVGAALLCADGTVYTGANIENASFPLTVCAERTAFFKAVSEGKRDFTAIAVSGGEKDKKYSACSPCGSCRQVMREFCGDDFRIVLFDGEKIKAFTLGELLPFGFSL